MYCRYLRTNPLYALQTLGDSKANLTSRSMNTSSVVHSIVHSVRPFTFFCFSVSSTVAERIEGEVIRVACAVRAFN